jgi:hypothetical protein
MTAASPSIDPVHFVTSIAQLRDIMGHTSDIIWDKAADHLSPPMAAFVAQSPFCVVASRGADGTTDISPRGDGPGFVRVLDPRTLVLPDRPGNRRYDTLRNVIETGSLSLMFIIPGTLDTVRVNGTAQITRDPALLAPSAMQGKTPDLGVIVHVHEAYGHCAKAIKRAHLWQPDTWVDPSGVPSLLDLMRAHLSLSAAATDDIRDRIDHDFRNNMY